MTQVAIHFWSDDPIYSDRGKWGEWFLVSSIDSEDVYIPDLPDGYEESESFVAAIAASTGIFIFTTKVDHFSDELGYEVEITRMHHLDLESKKWSLLDLEALPGEEASLYAKTAYTHNGEEYISFVLINESNGQRRIVDLNVASQTFFYTDVPSSVAGYLREGYVNRHFISNEWGEAYSRDDMSTPLLFEGFWSIWSRNFLKAYYDEMGQLNLIYDYRVGEGSGGGIYHEIRSNNGIHRTLVVPSEEPNIEVNTNALGISGSGDVYVAPASGYGYQGNTTLIRFYDSVGNLIKQTDIGPKYTRFWDGTAVSDDGQYTLLETDSDEDDVLLVDINGNYKNFSSSLSKYFQQDYDYRFFNPIFLPSQQENKPKPFWALFKNTVEVY